MGMIYKAKHVNMPAIYAVKVLPKDQLDEIAVLRFQNEAQAIAKLNHPNIISIYNFGLHDGILPFYVMELLNGHNLEQKLDMHGFMPVEVVLPVFIEICAGLNYAHRKGILHRDVKPSNFVILDGADVRGARVKVVDFGLVKFAEQLKPDVQKLTFAGEVCGSPSYMSPEQSSGKKIDPRSDIYSLGCSLYQALTGKLAFVGRTQSETMIMHHEEAAPTLASKSDGKVYSEYLELLVAKMLAKAPMDRYQTMESVALDLQNVMDGKPLGTPSPPQPSQLNVPAAVVYPLVSEKSPPLNEPDTAAGASLPKQAQPNYTYDRSHPSKESSDHQSATGARAPKMIVVSIFAACVAGTSLFFVWQAIPPVTQVSHSATVQSTTAPVAGVSPDKSKALEQIGPHLIAPDGPTGLEADVPALTQAPYFSQTISEGDKDYVEFDFPKPTRGFPQAWIGSSMMDSHRAEGKVRFPKGAKLYLMPLPSTVGVPRFFEKFRPGDITGICISPPNASDELLECAVKVPGISQLLLGHCSALTAKIVPALQKLNLSVLDVAGSNIDGELLAQLHFWQDLFVLNISKCKNVSPILKQVSGSKKLIVLDVAGDQLNATDYQLLAELPNLKVLNLSGNRVGTQDLRALSRLSKLTVIFAIYTRFADDSSLEELRQFPSLKKLTVLRGYLKLKDLQLLKQQCPNLKVEEKSVQEVMTMAGANKMGKWGE